MADNRTLIEQAYSAFNKRNIDGALALMTEDVSWPKASEGGRVVGRKRSAPIGLDNGASSIPMSNRYQPPRKTEARSASGFTKSSGALKVMFYRTAKFSTYSR